MNDSEEFEIAAEEEPTVAFENEIAEEPLVPPPVHPSRTRKLTFSFVALLLVLVGLVNLAMIVWFLLR
jgi:hypothetical protein